MTMKFILIKIQFKQLLVLILKKLNKCMVKNLEVMIKIILKIRLNFINHLDGFLGMNLLQICLVMS